MGSSFVVFFDPFFGEGSYFSDIGKEVSIENGFAVHAVESFDVTVLHSPAGLNKLNLDFMFLAPPLKTLEVNSGPLSVRITVGLPRHAITLSRVLIMRLEDRDVSISMAKASRVQSSMTLKVRNLRTPMMLSLIKSMLQL